MKGNEFENQLDELNKASKKTTTLFLLFAFLLGIISLIWSFYYRFFINNSGYISFILFLLYLALFFWLLFTIKRLMKKHAPCCPICNNYIGRSEKDEVLSTGKCPYCKESIIE
jgi:uncharacterized membrane protein